MNQLSLAKNIKAEHGLMYSALRRLHLRGQIDQIYQPISDETVDTNKPAAEPKQEG